MSENNTWQQRTRMINSNTLSSSGFTALMDVRALASYLHLDRQTIYNWLHQRRLSGIKLGGVWRFDRRMVDEWLQTQTVGTNTATGGGSKRPQDVVSAAKGESHG